MLKYDDINISLWIIHARDALHKARRRELHKLNINNGQGTILTIISDLGNNATPVKIAQRFSRETNTVSEILTRMEKEGLLERRKDMKKKNWVRIQLTEKGIKVQQQAIKRESIKKIMSCLTEEERRCLRSCCQKIRNKALEEMGTKFEADWPL